MGPVIETRTLVGPGIVRNCLRSELPAVHTAEPSALESGLVEKSCARSIVGDVFISLSLWSGWPKWRKFMPAITSRASTNFELRRKSSPSTTSPYFRTLRNQLLEFFYINTRHISTKRPTLPCINYAVRTPFFFFLSASVDSVLGFRSWPQVGVPSPSKVSVPPNVVA
jgi:hypothetical protein